MPPSDNVTAEPIQSVSAIGSELNAQEHLFRAMASEMATATVGLVKAVRPGGIGGASFVDLQPMVAQMDGAGNVVAHGVINNIPVFRLQSGGNAVVIDPAVGDIGIVVFAARDISAVKTSRAPAQPGSARRFDMADGLYIGGVLNGTATQYVEFAAGGINIVSPGNIAITADGSVTISAGGSITVTASGEVNISSSALKHNGTNVGSSHVHGGVQTGGANTTGPV